MTLTGRTPLLVLLGILPLLVRPEPSTAWLWVALVAAVVTLDWALAARPATLDIVRLPLPQVRLGEPATSALLVRNTGSRTVVGVLRDAWQPMAGARDNRHRLRLRPQAAVTLETGLVPERRGDLTAAGVTVRALGPLRLAGRQVTRDVPGSLRSLPRFESRKHLPSRLARLRELDGRSAVRARGQGTEFDSLRDYVTGDDVRSIDWRASARHRTVVVRTWQPERDRRVVIVLDTSRTSAARVADVPRLDSSMDAALLLAALASRAGDRVEVVAGDNRVRTRLRLSGSLDVAARLQDVMADLEPVLVEADWQVLAAELTRLGRQRALVVLLTALDSAAVEEGLLPVLPALGRHHRLVLASVQDPALAELAAQRSTADEVYDAAAAERVVATRRRTAEMLGQIGVDVIDVPSEKLAPALADHYLGLKARGLL